MHVTAPTADFQRAAEDVRINIEELTPMEGQKDMWRLPVETREKKPEVFVLTNLYNDEKYGSIRDRAERRGLRIEFDHALEVLLWQGTIHGQKNRMLVAIIIRNPPVPPSGPPAALSEPHEGDSVPVDTGKPPSPPSVDTSSQDHHQRKRLKTGRSITRESPANDKIAPNPQKGPEASQTGKEIDTKILKKRPEILISTRLEPPSMVGYIIEIDEVDALHTRTGFLAIILIRYRVEKLVKGSENQDAGKEGGLPLPSTIGPS